MSDSSLVQLALAFPTASERPLLALLYERDPELGEFSILGAAGHGHGFAHASIQEQVSGQADRRLLLAVMPQATARQLLQRLQRELPAARITWWLTPVLDFGRLA